jgi:Sec-independent protein translocase protein TatA
MEDSQVISARAEPDPSLGPQVGERRRNRWNLVLAALVALLLLGAGGFGYRAHADQAEASRARAATADLDHERDQLAAQSSQEDATTADLTARATAVHDTLERVVAVLDEVATAQNAYTDVMNKATDLHNSGQLRAEHDLVQGDGASALDAFQRSVAALDHLFSDAQAAVQHLQEGTHV